MVGRRGGEGIERGELTLKSMSSIGNPAMYSLLVEYHPTTRGRPGVPGGGGGGGGSQQYAPAAPDQSL